MSAERVECRLTAILATDNATGNFVKIVQRVPARIALPADAPLTWLFRPRPSITVSVDTRAESPAIAAASQDHPVGSARAKPAAPGSVIGW